MYLAAGRLLKGLLLAQEGRAEEGVALMREGGAGRLRAEALRRNGAGYDASKAALERALASARQTNAKSLELRAETALAELRST